MLLALHQTGVMAESATNLSRPTSRSSSSRLRQRKAPKSPPTCTISLANAGASCINTSTSISSPQSPGITFPSSSVPFPTSTSASDNELDSCYLDLLHPSARPEPLTQRPRSRAARTSQAEVRRRRSSARVSLSTKPSSSSLRPSKSNKRLLSDLRFLATVQRSIAWQLAKQDGWNIELASADAEDAGDDICVDMEMQDKLLVVRIRRHLVEQGCHPGQVLTPPTESRPPSSFPAPMAGITSTVFNDRLRTLSMPQLVAAHILRLKEHSGLASRSNTSSVRVSPRERSPLATCEMFL